MSEHDHEGRTEADAVVEASAKPEIQPYADGRRVVVLTPPGWKAEEKNLERLLDAPYRMKGTTQVENADSFVIAVENQKPPGYQPIVYADESTRSVTAVLNQQQVAEGEVRPGWGDHRVELSLTTSPEWTAWLGQDGEFLGQQDFAEFIQSRIDEITTDDPRHEDACPSQAEMLDLAQSFQANLTARFDRGHHLDSGQTRMIYTEDIQATAGTRQEMTVPDQFSIVVRPFLGHDPVYVRARIRYRLREGKISIGYQLMRPDLVERTIFDEVMTDIGRDLTTTVLRGSIGQNR